MLSLEAQVDAEQLAKQQAESDLVNAVRKAEARALEKAALDPEVVKAQKALEAANQ